MAVKDLGKGAGLVSVLLFSFGTVTFVFNVASIVELHARFSTIVSEGELGYPVVRPILIQVVAYAVVLVIALLLNRWSVRSK